MTSETSSCLKAGVAQCNCAEGQHLSHGCCTPGQQEYDWERSITLKMKEQVVAATSRQRKDEASQMSSSSQPNSAWLQEQMRRREVHMKESLGRVSQALHRRWRRQRDRPADHISYSVHRIVFSVKVLRLARIWLSSTCSGC